MAKVSTGPKESIKYTYFSACGNYPVTARSAPLSVFWSNYNVFGQQLWRENDNRDELYSNLGKQHDGHIPMKVLIDILNDVLGVKDFRKAYKNWTFKWEIGSSRYVNGRYEERVSKTTGKKYKVFVGDLETTVKKIVSDSQGNPPTTGFSKAERAEYRAKKGEE